MKNSTKMALLVCLSTYSLAFVEYVQACDNQNMENATDMPPAWMGSVDLANSDTESYQFLEKNCITDSTHPSVSKHQAETKEKHNTEKQAIELTS